MARESLHAFSRPGVRLRHHWLLRFLFRVRAAPPRLAPVRDVEDRVEAPREPEPRELRLETAPRELPRLRLLFAGRARRCERPFPFVLGGRLV